jgi:MerR family regulatory protein
MERGLLIGEVAARSGLSRKALRLYEARGILPAPRRRTPWGYRVCPQDVLDMLHFVARARAGWGSPSRRSGASLPFGAQSLGPVSMSGRFLSGSLPTSTTFAVSCAESSIPGTPQASAEA